MPTESEQIDVHFTNSTGYSLAIFDDDDTGYAQPLFLANPSDTVLFSQINGDWYLSSTGGNTLTLSDSFNFLIALNDGSGWMGSTDYEIIALGEYNVKWGDISGVTVRDAKPVSPTVSEPDDILEFFDESVADGILTGDGPGISADNRLNALENMLEMAGDLIDIGDTEGACVQLGAALNKCDGASPPPDFVAGEAATELHNMILELMDALGCE
jgi:hypothetical protein